MGPIEIEIIHNNIELTDMYEAQNNGKLSAFRSKKVHLI